METFATIIFIIVISYFLSRIGKSDNPEGQGTSINNNGNDPHIASQRDSWLNNYNYRRAMEFLESGDELQAYEYLKKALDEDNGNAYAHALMGHIYLTHQIYGTALDAFNFAIRISPESEHAFFFLERSRVYKGLGKEDERLADIRNSLEINPDYKDALLELAEYHYDHGEYDESDAAIGRYIALEPAEVIGYMVKGRNEMGRQHWESALELFEYASKLDVSYTAAWSSKAEALLKLGRIAEAIDCEIKALDLVNSKGEMDIKALFLQTELANVACDLFCLKLQAMAVRGNQTARWMSNIGLVFSCASRYSEAALWYHKAYEQDPGTPLLSYEAYCWTNAGNYARAVSLLRQALREDPDNVRYMQQLALALAEMGDHEEAIALLDNDIRIQPDETSNHFNRARFKQILGRYDEAIEDYTIELSLKDGKDAGAHLYRGMAYREIGEEEKALEDFNAITGDADMKDRELVLPLVYSLLGDRAKALESMEKLDETLQDASSGQPNDRIRALLFEAESLARIGEPDNAIAKMQEALELGACRFVAYRTNPEMAELRKDSRFEELMQRYELKVRESWKKGLEEPSETTEQLMPDDKGMAASLIPFEKDGGVFKVPCRVNGLPLHFVFDTGASDVTISTVEATFMLKNGYLKKQDLCGSQYYMTANGEIAEGTAVRLREVDFGGMKLTNVKASVVRSQNAPLLLGQSVLQRLGRIEIDNVNRVIRVNKTELPQTMV